MPNQANTTLPSGSNTTSPEVTQPVPPIAALDDVTLEQRLEAKIHELADLQALILTRNRQIEDLQEEKKGLEALLDKVEKNPFVMAITSTDGGAPLDKIAEKMRESILAVRELGGGAKVTVVLNIKRMEDHEDGLKIMPTITSKFPEPRAKTGIFFGDDEGGLSRQDTRQMNLRFGGRK